MNTLPLILKFAGLFVYNEIRFDMPLRRVNVRANAQEDGTSFTPPMPPRRVNLPDEGVGPLMEAMVGAFQRLEHFSGWSISADCWC